MTGAFGSAALHLHAFAAQMLGWRPDHFWNATPAELAAALAPCAADGAAVHAGAGSRVACPR